MAANTESGWVGVCVSCDCAIKAEELKFESSDGDMVCTHCYDEQGMLFVVTKNGVRYEYPFSTST